MNNFSCQSSDTISLFNKKKLLILRAIYHCNGDTCNCDLVDKLNFPKNLVSYHIKSLLRMKFIEEVRCGKNKKYTVSKKYLVKVKKVLELVDLS